jgi:hypothetical protein
MKKIFTYATFLLLLAGCSGKRTDRVAVITHIEVESTKWGCIGTGYKTWLKTDKQETLSICGHAGEPGDTLLVYFWEADSGLSNRSTGWYRSTPTGDNDNE